MIPRERSTQAMAPNEQRPRKGLNTLLEGLQRVKLRWNLVIWYTLALALVSTIMAVTITGRVRSGLDESLMRRGFSMVGGLVSSIQLPLLQQRTNELEEVLGGVLYDDDVAYAALVASDGRTILARRFGRDISEPDGDTLLRELLEESTFKEMIERRSRTACDERRIKHFVDVVLTLPAGGGALDGRSYFPEPPLQREVDGGERLAEEPEEDAFDAVVQPEVEGSEGVLGFVVLGLSKASNQEVLEDVIAWIGGTVLAGFGLFVVLSLLLMSRSFLLRPVADMQVFTRGMSDYDLRGRAERYADDELGEMADALNRLGENLRGVLGRIHGVTDSLGMVADRVATTSDVVARGAATTAASVDQTSSSVHQMLATLKGIAHNVEVLAQSAEESSASILQMDATNEQVAANIQSLAASVEDTSAAIEEMTYSIKEVAQNAEDLSATAEETSSAMNQMDTSIGQVETNANETAKLSEQVSTDARTAGLALEKTIAGIDKIKDSSRTAADVIEELGRKIGTIGNILSVIDDVAEQTDLLALNAAIIAAQAGDRGKGFAVVADEIKDLAERTGASTKEIAELIRAVQEESKNAIAAMDRGVSNVEEGVRLSGEAEEALEKITSSAGRSTRMVKDIARATVEQAKGSRQVTEAINRIAETVQEIARATSEQARGSEQIMASSQSMQAITKQVERSSQEQAQGSKQVRDSTENISEMVRQLNKAQKEQTMGAEQVMLAIESIKEVADNQNMAVKDLESAVDELTGQADVLRGEVKRFKV